MIGQYDGWVFERVPVPGDYDGDGTTDPAWYDPSRAIPLAGRLDRHPGAELVVWDPVETAWHLPGGPVIDVDVAVGVIPTFADFDGDRIDDLVVFGYLDGTWYDAGGAVLASDPRAVHGLPTTTPSATIMDVVRLVS